MKPKNRAWLLIVLVALLCGGAVWSVIWYRSRPIGTAKLLKRLPARDALIVYIDFEALRQAGYLQLLDGSKAGEDPDYKLFVRKINFDYKQDLDSALVAFTPTGEYFFVRGRFDWQSLRSYAQSEGGNCYNSLCQMGGSTPDRRISFFPVQSKLMALAVSPDQSAVLDLQSVSAVPDPDVPQAPVWFSIPASILSGDKMPTGTKMFARGMEKAEKVTLSFGPDGKRLAARLEVRCRTDQDATAVAAQLSATTLTLRQMLEREHQSPGASELAGVLISGSFRSEGKRVFGYWPIERAFLENLLGGGMG